jgi:uncharacterized protein
LDAAAATGKLIVRAPGKKLGTLARALVGGVLLAFAIALPATAEPDYPAFTAPVVDAAHVLGDADRQAITEKLLDLQRRTGVQFAVATIPSLGGDELEPYANALFRKWKLGQKGVNNGLLLILAPNERKLRFEIGYGLEGSFTDLQSKLILHNTMEPKLKAGDAAGALKAGVDDAITVLTSDKAALPERLKEPRHDSNAPLAIFFFIVFIIVFLSIKRRNRGGSGWFLPGAFIGGGGGSSSGWSSGSDSSSDSFSGGGGSDSGGGGSSDSY